MNNTFQMIHSVTWNIAVLIFFYNYQNNKPGTAKNIGLQLNLLSNGQLVNQI